MKVTLTNDFHHTKAIVLTDGYLSISQVKRAWKKLCGIKECKCSNAVGMRGKENPIIINYYSNGGIQLHLGDK